VRTTFDQALRAEALAQPCANYSSRVRCRVRRHARSRRRAGVRIGSRWWLGGVSRDRGSNQDTGCGIMPRRPPPAGRDLGR
jgi:hypothetical protein